MEIKYLKKLEGELLNSKNPSLTLSSILRFKRDEYHINEILKSSKFSYLEEKEQIFLVLNNLEPSLCPSCGSKLKFNSFSSGYKQTFCSQKCSNSNKNKIHKTKETKLKKYGDSNYVNSEKAKKTSLERYGVDNPSKSNEIKEKIKQSQINLFGDVITKTSYFKNKSKETKLEKYSNPFYTNPEKAKKTSLERYGAEHFNQSSFRKTKEYKLTPRIEIKNKENLNKLYIEENFIKDKILNIKILDYFGIEDIDILNYYLKKLKIDFKAKTIRHIAESEIFELGDFKHRYRKLGFELDFYDEKNKFAIEYNGLMWHSSGESKYKIFDRFMKPNYHLNKTEICEENGIQLYHIFENEWKNPLKRNIWKDMIQEKISKTNEKIICSYKEIKDKESEDFYSKYSLYTSGYNPIGLFYENNLIGVITDTIALKKGYIVQNIEEILTNLKRDIFEDRRFPYNFELKGTKSLIKSSPWYFKENSLDLSTIYFEGARVIHDCGKVKYKYS